MHKQPVYQNAPAYVNGVSEVIFKVGVFSKTYPSFLTLKEGSTSHLGLLPSGKKRETALLGARDRYALRLAEHQRSAPDCAGWDRLNHYLSFCFY